MTVRWAVAVALAALTWFSYAVWPGHTYLQSDTQIYVPVMEWLDQPELYPHDQLPRGAHVSLTVYDEVTRILARVTGDLESALTAQQLAFRAAGLWGIYLMATASQLSPAASVAVAALSSLGAWVLGPAVLTVEYEPVPRGFAIGLLLLALGSLARGWMPAAGMVASAATLYHAPAVWPFWLAALLLPGRWLLFRPLIPAAGLLVWLAAPQASLAESQRLFTLLSPEHAAIQQARAAYNWVSLWWSQHATYYTASIAIVFAADVQLRNRLPARLRLMLLVMAVLGVATMPVSYLLLEQARWALLPQLQPMRALLFTVQAAVVLAAIAAFTVRPWWARLLWLAIAVSYTFVGNGHSPRRLESPAIRQLAEWARSSTRSDAVFLFVGEGRGLTPGIFRARSLRSVYTDWKAGGQVNYFPAYAAEWWKRWNTVGVPPYSAGREPQYRDLGIDYLVSRRPLPDRTPVWRNDEFAVYRLR